MSRRAKVPPAPRSATLDGFLKAVHSETVALFLKEAESSTAIQFSRRAAEKHLAIVEEAKGILRDLPAVLPAFPAGERLAAVEEAEAAILAAPDIPKPSDEERRLAALEKVNPERARQYREEHPAPEPAKESPLVSEERSRAIVHAIRVVFDSIGEVVDALEARRAAANEAAKRARNARAEKRAAIEAAPEEDQERIRAAVEEAKALTTAKALHAEVQAQTYETIRGTTNFPLEPLGNSMARGQTSTPAVVVPGPGNALEFRSREAGEETAPAALEVRSKEATLTGEEVLGPVERQVWRAILVQASRVQNPADLVGVSVKAYAEANGVTYSAAKKAIEKAVDSLYVLSLSLGEDYAAAAGLPTRLRFLDAVYGERKKLVEGYYLVQLGTTIVKHLAGGRAIQFPLFPALEFQANPNADLFIQLFSINKAQNTGASNQDSVSVRRLAQAAGLLRGESKNRYRAKEIVERDLKAAEKCGRGQILAPFSSHVYKRNGARLSAANALALPIKDWLTLSVEVKWNPGALDFSRKERAIRARQERLAIEEAKATIRKGTRK